MDRRLRQLERRALSGDPQAQAQLKREQIRSGQLPPWTEIFKQWLVEEFSKTDWVKVPFPIHNYKADEAWIRNKWPEFDGNVQN